MSAEALLRQAEATIAALRAELRTTRANSKEAAELARVDFRAVFEELVKRGVQNRRLTAQLKAAKKQTPRKPVTKAT